MTGRLVREDGSLSAAGLAAALSAPYPPSAEQAAVIESPLTPVLVVAGAGSGKTATMADRVVYLVATGQVAAEHVLGLTFTRKAAAELSARVRSRLAVLGGSAAPDLAVPTPDAEPTIVTYHAFAGRVLAEHGVRAGYEPGLRVVSPAVQWQLADAVVQAYDAELPALDYTPQTVVTRMLALAGELAEHLVPDEALHEFGERLRGAAGAAPPAGATAMLSAHQARLQLLPLIAGYRRAKAARGVIDYGDQVELATRLALQHPEVARLERERYRVVLLDEYQDTGHAQRVLLSTLFGDGHPVTAVGDPCQSIYGWRGATAANLNRFTSHFPRGDGSPSRRSDLLVSHRNGERVLRVANALSARLRTDAVPVGELRPATDRTGRGEVTCGLFETSDAEAAWICGQALRLHRTGSTDRPTAPGWAAEGGPVAGAHPASGLAWSDMAVLMRRRSQFLRVRAALEAAGVPVEVVSLGGLLTVPEVQDLVATLRLLHDPDENGVVVRLLTGPRWRLGTADLAAVGARARDLARMRWADLDREHTGSGGMSSEADSRRAVELVGHVRADAVTELLEKEDQVTGSLAEALDDLGDPARYSAEGYRRLRLFATELTALRRRVDQPLPDLVADVERSTLLDIEVAARPSASLAANRADLDAFADVAADFAGDDEHPTLGGFLAYLTAAEDEEFGLETARVGSSDSVKLMTVHGAKGLEWRAVFVPGLSAGKRSSVFPAAPRGVSWATACEQLPFDLRGDAADLPALPAVLTKQACEAHTAACKERHATEERRLAYVAVTRARDVLLCSGYWWGDGGTPLGPSVFLEEVRSVCAAGTGTVEHWSEPPAEHAPNPLEQALTPVAWPVATSAPGLAEGAALVRAALAAAAAPEPGAMVGDGRDAGGRSRTRRFDHRFEAPADRPTGLPTERPTERPTEGPTERRADRGAAGGDDRLVAGWARDVDVLLSERAATASAAASPVDVALPDLVSVTALVGLAADTELLASEVRRPLPRRPNPVARRGTAFHLWLEQRFGQTRLFELDELPGSADAGVTTDDDLEGLKAAFLASTWADRRPVEVEVPFDTPVGGLLVRGRMDAVFADPDGRFDVVDWKTGKRPTGPAADAASVQLAVYRLAWSRLAGVPMQDVRAAFHYVRSGETVRPVDLLDEAGLEALVRQVPVSP